MVGRLSESSELVGTPSQTSRTGRDTLSEVQNWLGDTPKDTEVDRRPYRRSGSVRETLRRYGSGRKTISEDRKWSEDPPGGLEVVGRPSGGPEVVGRPFRRTASGRKTLLEVRKRS